jgi:predicted Holliday junction resolvase-like endonuclease
MTVNWLDIVLIISFLFLLIQMCLIKVNLESKAKELFESWKEHELFRREEELAKLAISKAQVELQRWKLDAEERIRRDAIVRSKAVISGKVTEHLIPYFPDFKYDPSDVRFLGSPVDLIVFDGLSEGKLKKIVFIEIKTGKKPNLSLRERLVQDCVLQKNFEYELLWQELGEISSREHRESFASSLNLKDKY